MTRPGRARLVVGLAVLAPVLAACGSQTADVEPPASDAGAGSSPSTSSSPSTGSSPGARTTTRTRSALESRPQVKAVRAWASAVAREVNSRSTSHEATRRVTTARAAKRLPRTYASEYGLRYPGPVPLTPVSVQTRGSTARVAACVQTSGWGVDGQGVSPEGNVITASSFVLKRVRGTWKLDRIVGRTDSCDGVTVKGYSS